jgi:hypothetical protein
MTTIAQIKVEETKLQDIYTILSQHRFSFTTESELQAGIAEVLRGASIHFDREFCLLPKDRIDFMVGDVGIEVKTAGSLAGVTRQLFRYSESPLVGSLLLVTNRIALHSHLPVEMNHKPLRVLRLVNSAL